MLDGKKLLIIERLFETENVMASERIKGATTIKFKKKITAPELARLSSYYTILMVDHDKNQVWVN